MKKLSHSFFLLSVLNASYQSYLHTTPGGAALAALPGIVCGTVGHISLQAHALPGGGVFKTTSNEHDPWD